MSVFGLLNFKEWVTWPWCEREFASHAKSIVTYAWILTPRPFKERLLTSCFQNLQKLNITLSNTDNFALQCFPFADFKFLNLTWDLKVGVPRIGNDRFQTSINDVEVSHIYVHADEIVYSKLCHIIWKNPELYKCIVTLMGGFHQLHVKQRLIYKRSNCIGIKEWSIDAGIIAPGSVTEAIEGYHYYRCMHLHKECFDTLSDSDLIKWKVIYFFQSFGEA